MRTPRALAAFLLIAAPLVPRVEAAESPREEAQRLARENEILKRRVDLSKEAAFYLLLDPTAMSLKLMLRGAVLQVYKVQGLEVGEPQVAFVSRGLPEDWEGRIWTGGALDPARAQERVELVGPPPSAVEDEDSGPAPPIPPLPEDAYPVPARYHVRFNGGLALEVSPGKATEDKSGFWSRMSGTLGEWWSDVRAVLRREPKDTVRLRMTLTTEDANSLYRALPPDTKLFIVPPT